MAVLKKAYFNGTNGSHFYIELSYNETINTNANTSTIKYTLVFGSQDGYSGSGTGSAGYINGTNVGSVSSIGVNSRVTVGTKTVTVAHNNDGTGTASYSASYTGGNWGIGNASLSGSFTLTKINRASKINTFVVENSNVEGNISATYTNYISTYRQKLRISIPYVEVLQTYDNYTSGDNVTLGISAIEEIQSYMNTNHVSTVTIGGVIETWNGNTKIGESSEIRLACKFLNADPSLTYSMQEQNQNVINVLGSSDATTVIQNASQIQFTVVPEAKKGSSISNVTVTHNNTPQVKTTSPYNFLVDVVTNNSTISTTDIRNLTSSLSVVNTLIEYQPVAINSFNFERQNPTSSNLILNAEFKYYQKTFNQTANVPTIQWQCVEDGQSLDSNSWITISSSDYTIDTTNNKITITNLLLSNVLDYRTKGTLYLKINDLLTEFSNNMPVIKGIPTMDMGEHDVCINGELYIADEDRENKINVKSYLQKDVKTLTLSGNKAISSSTAIIPFDQVEGVGDKLTFSNNSIYIGSGVTKILVSANASPQYNSSAIEHVIQIYKNDEPISYIRCAIKHQSTSEMFCLSLSPCVLDVAEGDKISLYKASNFTVVRAESYMTVEAIEYEES